MYTHFQYRETRWIRSNTASHTEESKDNPRPTKWMKLSYHKMKLNNGDRLNDSSDTPGGKKRVRKNLPRFAQQIIKNLWRRKKSWTKKIRVRWDPSTSRDPFFASLSVNIVWGKRRRSSRVQIHICSWLMRQARSPKAEMSCRRRGGWAGSRKRI